MSTPIKELTPEQEKQLEVYRDKWIDIGLATEPADRKKAEEGVVLAYKAANLKPPKEIIWCDSPIQGLEVVSKLTGKSEKSQFSYCIYGQHEASWLCFYDYLEYIGVDCVAPLKGLKLIAQSCGWWWALDEAAVMTERPSALKVDERGRLHCADGPAIAYRDGWKLYFYKGINVEERIIETPETITSDEIEKEANLELRRILLEIFGWDKYIQDSGAEKIMSDDFGTLYKKQIQGDEDLVMVKVVNSTREQDGTFKEYFIRVKPDVKTAHEAVASTFQMSTSEYNRKVLAQET